jgi:hypothetical protein
MYKKLFLFKIKKNISIPYIFKNREKNVNQNINKKMVFPTKLNNQITQ